MPSVNGPYTVQPDGSGYQVIDNQGTPVEIFQNNKAYTVTTYGTAGLDRQNTLAASLSSDDTEYLALVKAHYLGGPAASVAASNILLAIASIEAASFASDPAAIAALNTLRIALVAI